jgi:hypothetical protein
LVGSGNTGCRTHNPTYLSNEKSAPGTQTSSTNNFMFQAINFQCIFESIFWCGGAQWRELKIFSDLAKNGDCEIFLGFLREQCNEIFDI